MTTWHTNQVLKHSDEKTNFYSSNLNPESFGNCCNEKEDTDIELPSEFKID